MQLGTADQSEMEALRIMSQGEQNKLLVRFYMEAEQDDDKSAEAGRPIFVERPYIEIRIPGNKDEIRRRPVRYGDAEKFPPQWAAFKNKEAQPVIGTPLEALPFLTKAQVLEFKASHCLTAEHVRDMPDSLAQKFMGSHSIRQRITAFLDAAAGAAPAEKLQAELQKRDDVISAQSKALADQGTKLAELTKIVEALPKAPPPAPVTQARR